MNKSFFYLFIAFWFPFFSAAGMIQTMPQTMSQPLPLISSEQSILMQQNPQFVDQLTTQKLSLEEKITTTLKFLCISIDQPYNTICLQTKTQYNALINKINNDYHMLISAYYELNNFSNRECVLQRISQHDIAQVPYLFVPLQITPPELLQLHQQGMGEAERVLLQNLWREHSRIEQLKNKLLQAFTLITSDETKKYFERKESDNSLEKLWKTAQAQTFETVWNKTANKS